MKTVFRCALLAGLAISGTAFAGEDTLVPAGSTRVAPASAVRMPTIQASQRSNQNVYAVVDIDNGVFTNTALPKQLLDDVSVVPGPGSNGTFPMTINGMDLSFSVTDPLADFDIEVTFWDSVDVLAPANSPVHLNLIDGFAVGIASANLPGAGAYTTGIIDLSGLPSGGIVLPDAGTFVLIRYVEPGTTTLTSASVQIVYDSTIDAATFASTVVGSTDINTWRDADGDGIIEAAEARSFVYPGRGGALIALQADVPSAGNPCPADFNGDQFVDFFDYGDFVAAFETGC